jgi:antitoxin ParD1/3/4
MNVRVARHFEVWIEEQVASGRFGDPSQVVEEALRLLEQREARLADLRQAIQEGEASGPPEALDFAALRQRLHEQWDAEQPGQG